MLFKLEPGEKIVYKGGLANTWRVDPLYLSHQMNNATSSEFCITNKRIVSKKLFLFQGVSIPFDKIETVTKTEKGKDYPGRGITINHNENGKKKSTEIVFILSSIGAQKKRDKFYNELKKHISSKVK